MGRRGGGVKGGVGTPVVWAGRVEKGGAQGWGPKPKRSGGSKGGGSKGGGSEGWGEGVVGSPKFSLFFSFSRRKFHSFSSLWWSSRGILVVFEAPGRSNVHVWAFSLTCEAPTHTHTETNHKHKRHNLAKLGLAKRAGQSPFGQSPP